MKTPEEILAHYVEQVFRHTKVVDKDNAIKAINQFHDQFSIWNETKKLKPKENSSVWAFYKGKVEVAFYWDFCGKKVFHCNEEIIKPSHWQYIIEPKPPVI